MTARKNLLATAAMLTLALLIAAQVSGRLTGRVVDPSGAAVPEATINLRLAGASRTILTAQTTVEGLFHLTGVRPEFYDVVIEAKGLRQQVLRRIKVDPGRETSLPPIKLELGSVTEVVEVQGTAELVQITNAEVAVTMTDQQLRRLPVPPSDRDPLQMLITQAGVSYDSRTNGQRTAFAQVTMDGISLADPLQRNRSLSRVRNRLRPGQVGEVTISTSNANATTGGASR